MGDSAGWKVELVVSKDAADVFAAALEGQADAVSAFEAEGGWRIEAYFGTQPDRMALTVSLALAAAAAGVVEPGLTLEPLPHIDWLAQNQASFRPIRAGRYFIHPSHYSGRVPAGAIGIEMDAASAFGTGEHGSTRGCLLAFDRLARRRRVGAILDIGCGTGILAIAAAKTWRVQTLACDIDSESVRVARGNVRRNGVAAWVRVRRGNGYRAAGRARRYDLIVANILAGPLCAMAADLAAHLAHAGTAVLSGLLSAQEQAVLVAHRRVGLRLVERIRLGEWSTLVLRR